MHEQHTPKHRRKYSVLREMNTPARQGHHRYDRTLERLGAAVFDSGEFGDLLAAVGPGNPFRRGAL